MRRTQAVYVRDAQSKNRLNGRNSQPNRNSITLVTASFFASCPRSSSAESAGESVSELNAEMTVLIAIVTANCL